MAAIEFRCDQFIADPATGQKRPCRKRLRAPAGSIGSTVVCPNCQQHLIVPSHPSQPSQQTNATRNSPLEVRSSSEDFDDGVSDDFGSTGTLASTAGDIMKVDFDAHSGGGEQPNRGKPFVPLDRSQRCRKCGRQLKPNGRCSVCNFVEPSMKLASMPLEKIKIRPVGFQLWLTNIISEGLPAWVVVILVHILMLIFTLAGGVAIAVSSGGLTRIAAFGVYGAMIFLYAGFTFKAYRFRKDPQAKLAWFQRPLWNLVLRYMRWQDWVGDGKPRIIINEYHSTLTDQQLDRIKDLKHAAVLDLEGTQITDDAFRYFYRLEKLEFLVLKNTQVSHEAVFRLQQSKPKLWVWY